MGPCIIGAAFAAGLLSFFSPCILPLLPVYVGLLTTSTDNREFSAGRRLAHTLAFVLGISVTFLILGLGAGAIGRVLNTPAVAVACGIVIFLFGLHLSGFVQIPALNRERRADMSKLDVSSTAGAFLLGLGFSFGWTPCVGPILGSVLALASQQGTAIAGAALTLVYALGLSIPFLVITLAWSLLADKVRKVNRFLPIIQRVGGVLIAIMGLWMVFSQVESAIVNPFTLSAEAPSAQQAADSPDDAENGATAADRPSSDSAESNGSSSSIGTAASQSGTEGEVTEANRWRYMEMRDIDGQTHMFQDYVGKPLYIKLWGTWCPICMSELDNYAQIAEEHNTAGDVQVVSVVAPGYYGEKQEDEFVAWAHEQGLTFPILMDSNDELNSFFAIGAYPTSIFVDSSGSVQLMRTGAIDSAELEEILASLE